MFKKKDAIGRRLRDIRKSHTVSGIELARCLNCTQSLVSKIETGRIKPSSEYVKNFCSALSLSKSIETELIQITTAFLFNFDRWNKGDSSFADVQELVRLRERQANLIQSFSLNLMSGLIQTEGYARAIFTNQIVHIPEKEVVRSIRARMRRQSIVEDPKKTIQIVISEASLANWITSSGIMKEQLEKIVNLIDRNIVEIRILPFFKPTLTLPINSFSVYDEEFVAIETQTFSFQLWEADEVSVYSQLFQKMLIESISGKKARELVMKNVNQMKNFMI